LLVRQAGRFYWVVQVHYGPGKEPLAEQRAVESTLNGRGPWWNSEASHMNQAFPKRYFQKLELISLLDKLLDYKKTVTNGTAVYGTVRTVV
jgi:hypothetical protein